MTFPILRVLGGASFLLAGLMAFYKVILGPSVFLLFILAGAVVILVALSGTRPRPGDIALFILGIIVLGAASAGYTSTTPTITTYSATTAQVHANKIALTIRAAAGSVSIFFLDRSNLAYEINFTQPFGSFSVPFVNGQNSVTNSSNGGVFSLRITSSFPSVDVFLRHGYFVNISAITDTGSLSLATSGNEEFGSITLSTSTGSINAMLDTTTISALDLQTSTGSINLESNHFGTTARGVPVTLSTSLGSVGARLVVPNDIAVSLSATTNLGSINHDLAGFSVSQDTRTNLVASAGDASILPYSFVISSSTNLGSQNLKIGR